MISKEKKDIIMNAIHKQNSIINIKNLMIPIPDGFSVISSKNDSSREVFAAKKNNTIIELLIDGPLNPGEALDDRINGILNKIIEKCNKDVLYKNNNKYLMFLGNYIKNDISAKVYAQDVMVNEDTFIRMINAYFVEKKSKEVCQLSVSSGKFSIHNRRLLNSINDFQKDELIKVELQILMGTLGRIKYLV